MKLDRMALADCTTPKKLLDALLGQIPDLPLPVPIEEIAAALDIEQIQSLDTEGFEGGLIAFDDKSSGTILVNKRSPRQRQRFTIGHELGHFLNPWHVPPTGGFRCTAGDMRRFDAPASLDRAAQMEVEANAFSAGLLMPDADVRKTLRVWGTPEMSHILTLAERYDVSKEAAARKYVTAHDDPCAIIFSRRNEVLYGLRGADFPYLDIRKGRPVPTGSLTKRKALGDGVVGEQEEVDPHSWLSRPRGVTRLTEQTLGQRDGYRMTLLCAKLAEADEEEDPRQVGEPRFRR